MESWDDTRLFLAMCEGNKSALSVLYLRYYNYLFHYGSRIGPYESIVEECINDLFIHLFQSNHQLVEVRNVKAYLFKALRRRIIEKIKAEQKQKNREQMVPTVTNIQFVEADLELSSTNESALNHYLVKILNDLPWRQKEALYLRYYNNLSTKEIAEIMGIANQTVLNTLHHAITKIRKNNVLEMIRNASGFILCHFIF